MKYNNIFLSTLTASAIASTLLPASAMAEMPSIDLYGRIDLGFESYNDSDGVGAHIFAGQQSDNGNLDEQDIGVSNGNHSRLGVKGSTTLDTGVVLGYQYELLADVLNHGGAPTTRQAWLSMAKGKHSLKVGTQDNPLYDYSAWNAQKSEVHGYGAYYYTTCDLPGSLQCTFRTESTVNYTYGSGGYGRDPFTVTAALHFNGDGRNTNGDTTKDNVSGVTGATIAGAATFDNVTVNAAYQTSIVSEGDDYDSSTSGDLPAPSIISLGGKYFATDDLEVGFFYHMLDKDVDEDDTKTAFALSGTYQLNSKMSLHAGYGAGEDDDDMARQLDSNVYAQLIYATSESSHIRLEVEQVSYSSDNDALEGDANIVLVSLRQDF
ncbi:porin [Bacterioplanoides sp. SCSIO 12839]|uniref:porin n=1 Tax=Bacterioplanoides sp. SCSIO 12839 TaxID=2829569 RepID=UPI0021034009|nr:porin [Bacterioplanoides sp. SCSIO 12839]UTW47487.1 porin [Bacterioplanoides sp. SCSIO 12839]